MMLMEITLLLQGKHLSISKRNFDNLGYIQT